MHLAILDDDSAVGGQVTQLMARAGHQVTHYVNAKSMLRSLRQDSFDLLMLDWNLPESSGLEVLGWIQEHLDPSPPTIMITARTAEADIVTGLTNGADDYVFKPLQDHILIARVDALLRRVYGERPRKTIERFGDHVFNLNNRVVTVMDVDVALTAKEFALALLLFRNLERPLSRSYILADIWGTDWDPSSRTLDAHISQIRKRLRLHPDYNLRLSSVYNFGYRLERIASPLPLRSERVVDHVDKRCYSGLPKNRLNLES